MQMAMSVHHVVGAEQADQRAAHVRMRVHLMQQRDEVQDLVAGAVRLPALLGDHLVEAVRILRLQHVISVADEAQYLIVGQ